LQEYWSLDTLVSLKGTRVEPTIEKDVPRGDLTTGSATTREVAKEEVSIL